MKRLLLSLVLFAAPLYAQSAGKAGKQVLQFDPGSRAAALAGAFSAAHGDAEAAFYNAAGLAGARDGASAAYETRALDVAFGSASAFTRFGRVNVGVGVAYLDAGTINEITPDPDFGGNIGVGTGQTASANESSARVSLATAFGRVRLGASAGFVSSSIANENSSSPFVDAGAQYDAGRTAFGLVVRNVGGNDLPAEARLGANRSFRLGQKLGINASLDGVARLRESTVSAVAGVEAGLMPTTRGDVGAVVRFGFDGEPNQISALRLGAGITVGTISLDYAYQSLDFVGVVHRFGVRWSGR